MNTLPLKMYTRVTIHTQSDIHIAMLTAECWQLLAVDVFFLQWDTVACTSNVNDCLNVLSRLDCKSKVRFPLAECWRVMETGHSSSMMILSFLCPFRPLASTRVDAAYLQIMYAYSSCCQLRHFQLRHCIVNDVISTGVVWWSLARTFWPFIVIRSPIACV